MNLQEISFVIMIGVMAAFYLIFIRPARQEQERHQETIRDLHVGDEVITTAGFFATIKDIRTPEQGPVELVLDFGNGIQVRSLTSSVLKRISRATEAVERQEVERA
jgi:preprotein translocase YajC subunit